MVEFGLIALLFCLLLFGTFDFGMLLNGWINVSTGSGAAARQAAVGQSVSNVYTYVTTQSFSPVPGVSPASLKVAVSYDGATYCPNTATWTGWSTYGVTCSASAPSAPNSTGDAITVTVIADQFEVATPLVRPFFGCAASATHCYVPLRSSTTARYEGGYIL